MAKIVIANANALLAFKGIDVQYAKLNIPHHSET